MEKQKVLKKKNILITIGISIFLIASIIIFNINNNDNEKDNVIPGVIAFRSLDTPNNYSGLQLANEEDALTAANNQLENMQYGNIYTINEQDDDYCIFFYIDASLGGLIYWQISDSQTQIYINAINLTFRTPLLKNRFSHKVHPTISTPSYFDHEGSGSVLHNGCHRVSQERECPGTAGIPTSL